MSALADAKAAAAVFLDTYDEVKALSRKHEAAKATLKKYFADHPAQRTFAGVAALRGSKTMLDNALVRAALGDKAKQCEKNVDTVQLEPVGRSATKR